MPLFLKFMTSGCSRVCGELTHYRRRVLFFIALLLSALATGCADLSPQQRVTIARPAQPVCHNGVTLAGRFSVQYRKDDKDESLHGSFQWEQRDGNTRIALLSPVGQTLATMAVAPDSATLTPAGQQPIHAPDADALAASTLGWALPVSGLRDWLQGCARDERGHRFVASPERNRVTTQDGWQIAYLVWEGEGDARRPRRIDLQRKLDGVAPEISLRLIIDEWQLRR